MLGFRGFFVAVLALAAAPAIAAGPVGPSAMEGRWKSDIRDIIILDIVTCGHGYCGQQVLPSGCGETVLRLVATGVSEASLALEGTMTVPPEKHTYKAFANFDKGDPEHIAYIFVDGYDELPSYEHREYPFGASFYRIGAATCRAVPAS